MAQYNILGLGIQGRSLNVSAQKRLNLYYDIQPIADKSRVAAYGTPGLQLFEDLGATSMRGMYWMQSVDFLYVVYQTNLYEINAAGTATLRGTLLTNSGYVDFSDNGTELMIVDGTYGYIYNTGTTTFTRITAAGFPGADTVCFLDSFFIVNKPNSQQFFVSGSYDGLTWDSLSFASAESNPDDIIRIASDKGILIPFGDVSIEFWQTIGAIEFPFARITGSPSQVGLGARWSLARCGKFLTFLGKVREGQYEIMQLQGLESIPVSTPEVSYAINHYPTVLDAVAFSYRMNGHDFYQISFPQADATWLYDATTNAWSQLKSYGIGRHLANQAVSWNENIVASDYSNGKLYYLSDTTYSDNGAIIERELIGPHVFDGNNIDRTTISRIRLDMEEGVGATVGQGSDPTIMLQISRDGGHTYGTEMWTQFGPIGNYRSRAEWRRLGYSRDWNFKFRITDPVKVAIIGAYLES